MVSCRVSYQGFLPRLSNVHVGFFRVSLGFFVFGFFRVHLGFHLGFL